MKTLHEKQNQIQLYINSGHKVVLLPYIQTVLIYHKDNNSVITPINGVNHFTMITLLNDNSNISTINKNSFEIQLRD